MKKCKWENPYEWLRHKVEHWTHAELKAEFLNLVNLTELDIINDIYRSVMDKDGYFDMPEISEEEVEQMRCGTKIRIRSNFVCPSCACVYLEDKFLPVKLSPMGIGATHYCENCDKTIELIVYDDEDGQMSVDIE